MKRARFMGSSTSASGLQASGVRFFGLQASTFVSGFYGKSSACVSHFAVPVLGLRVDGAEDFHVPFSSAPRFDHFGSHDIDENLGKEPALGVALEMVGGLVPSEVRIQHQ